MAMIETHRTSNTLMLLAICIGSAMLGLASGNRKTVTVTATPSPFSVRQSDQKSIVISARPDELLEFGNVNVKNVKITPNRKFSLKSLAVKDGEQVDDWLENLEFSLKNTSDKHITYIQFEIQFPDTEVNGPLMVYREFGIGVDPEAGSRSRGGALRNDRPLDLEPGTTTIATLSTAHLERIKHFIGLRNFQLTNINTVVVKILGVYVDDGLMWSSGHYYRLNPGSRGGYERVN
jgi:hypothetical protein